MEIKGGSKIKGDAKCHRKRLLINYSWGVWSRRRHNYSAFVV